MARFDELFDEVFEKAKYAADAAGKKTSEMVEVGKLKYKAKQISWEIERTYSKLGVIVYEAKKSGGEYDTVIDAAVEEIDALNKRLDELEEKVRQVRKADTKRPVNDSEEASEEASVEAPEEAPVEVVVEFAQINTEDAGEE